MLLSFIALTPAHMPDWYLGGLTWLVPVVLIVFGAISVVGAIPSPTIKEAARRLITACVIAVALSGVLLASELIRQDVPECASLEPYSALWFAFGCWWPF